MYLYNCKFCNLHTNDLVVDPLTGQTIRFGITDEGEYGYKKVGSDMVTTFGGDTTDLENRIDEVEGSVSTLSGTVNSLSGRTSTNETNISSNTSSISSLTTRTTTAESKITTLESKIGVDLNKNTFTEAEFLEVLQHNLQGRIRVGSIITLSNPYCTKYEVIDFNHDGTTNTIDVISTTQVSNMQQYNTNIASNGIYTWLNNTYYNSFNNNIKNYIKDIWISDGYNGMSSKFKILSKYESGYIEQYSQDGTILGSQYTKRFNSGNPTDYSSANFSRFFPKGNYGNDKEYWLRDRINNYHYVSIVNNDYLVIIGSIMPITNWASYKGIVPVFRF